MTVYLQPFQIITLAIFHSFSNICQKFQSTLGQLAYFSTTAQKMKFTIKDLVTFTEEILNGNFPFSAVYPLKTKAFGDVFRDCKNETLA